MRGIDETDREILRLLIADGRRPYSDIADQVGLSPPAVSDRVERLEELGVIDGFTVEVDRTRLAEGTTVMVELDVDPGHEQEVTGAVGGLDRVEHVFRTADADVVFLATLPDGDVGELLADAVDTKRLRDVRVRLVDEREWTPSLGEASLALACAECGNSVTSEGESLRLEGDLFHFCCESCLENYRERYGRIREGM